MPIAWPFYALGVLLALVGFAALRRVVAEARDQRRSTGPLALIACILAFVLGGSVIVVAMAFDATQYQTENSRTFILHISAVPDLPGPFSFSLPAPMDPRVMGGFNRTNGSSTLRIAGTAPAQFLQLDASGNVSFDVIVTVVGTPFNRTLARVSAGPPADGTRAAPASIDLQSPGNVNLTFAVRYSEFCAFTTYVLDAAVADGSGIYTGLWTVQLLGCPAGS